VDDEREPVSRQSRRGREVLAVDREEAVAERRLSRTLKVALPLGLVAGAALGTPLALWLGDWQAGVWMALLVAAITGFVVAAREDGRAQRRVDDRRREAVEAALREMDRWDDHEPPVRKQGRSLGPREAGRR
jgi:hypothetical protein